MRAAIWASSTSAIARSTRCGLEKAYRLWGADMSADYTPLEAGLERFVKLDKGDFVGREALLRQLDTGGPSIRLSCLTIDADDADAHAYEPVYADDRLVTYVMAGGYGHTVGKSIALAYLPTEQSASWHGARGGDPRRAPRRPRGVTAAVRPGQQTLDSVNVRR